MNECKCENVSLWDDGVHHCILCSKAFIAKDMVSSGLTLDQIMGEPTPIVGKTKSDRNLPLPAGYPYHVGGMLK